MYTYSIEFKFYLLFRDFQIKVYYISSSNIYFIRKEKAIFNHIFDYTFHLFFEPSFIPVNPPNILRSIFRNITGCDVTASRQ